MTKKLYRCETTIEVMILSEEPPLDCDIEEAIVEEIRNNGLISVPVFCREAKELKSVPKDWHNSIPYGNDVGDMTVAEILSQKNKP